MIETTRLFQDGMLYRFRVTVPTEIIAPLPRTIGKPISSFLASRDRSGYIRVPERVFLPIEQYDWLHDTLIGRRPYYEKMFVGTEPDKRFYDRRYRSEYFVYFRRYEDAFNYCMRWRSA